MAERVKTRERDPELLATGYTASMKRAREYIERGINGKVVITNEDHPWEMTNMGRYMYYLHDIVYDESALAGWRVFVNDIRIHSGAHRHQGGIIIYVLEGSGYTIIEGEKEEWEAGDLLLVPMMPGGAEHQHFNNVPGQPCKWVAYMYMAAWDALCSDQVVTKPPRLE